MNPESVTKITSTIYCIKLPLYNRHYFLNFASMFLNLEIKCRDFRDHIPLMSFSRFFSFFFSGIRHCGGSKNYLQKYESHFSRSHINYLCIMGNWLNVFVLLKIV